MKETTGNLIGRDVRIGIVASRFNELIVESLTRGAVDCLQRHGVKDQSIELVKVPGAWELPLAAQRLARSGRCDGIVALGAVIRGGTAHFEYICGAMTQGLSRVALEQDLPVSFGVLTTDSIDQALERAGTKAGNKGVEAALAVLEMLDVVKKLET